VPIPMGIKSQHPTTTTSRASSLLLPKPKCETFLALPLMSIGRPESLPVLRKCSDDASHAVLAKFAKLAVNLLEKR